MRGLERRIGDLCRKAAVQSPPQRENGLIRVAEELVREWLGPARFLGRASARTADPGVATGARLDTPVAGTSSSSRRSAIRAAASSP